MTSHIIPKIGQKVKPSYDARRRYYPGLAAFEHSHDIGIITEIEYSGFRLEDAKYNHRDTIYTVTFPATIFDDELIFNPWEELTFVDCCGRVHSPCSGEIVNPFERIFPEDNTKSGLPIRWIRGNYPEGNYPRIEPKCKEYSPFMSIIDKLSTYDPMKEYIKNDVEMSHQLYLYQYMQQHAKPVKVETNVSMSSDTDIGKELHEFVKKLMNINYGRHNAERKDPLVKTVKTSEKEKTTMSTIDFRVKKIMHNGPATIVFWKDGTKTVVRLKDGDKYDPYAAFTAAVAKRLYGKTVKISEIVDRYSKDLKKIDIPEAPPRDLSVEELKAAAEKLGYRVSKKPKK